LDNIRSHRRASLVLAVLAIALLWVPCGCSRQRYYCQADKEAARLVAEKSRDLCWNSPAAFTVDKDPRSRYYDPCDQIFPPMPEDDPESNRYMVCVDGMKGFRRWHAHGDRQQLGNADWRARLGESVELTAEGSVKLSLASAVRLAYLNSPDYQGQLETLYLSALDVSTERFRFDTQFLGTNSTSFTHQGRLNADGKANTLQTDTSFEFERRFAAAGELVVGFANSIVWQFAGPDTFSNVSILNFNLVQPLLRDAGRAVALEQLTIVERALLANVRALERYREGFYSRIAIGDGVYSGLQRRGGFFGGTGMTGFTGTGIGGFGSVGGLLFGGGSSGYGGSGGGSGGGFAGGGAGQLGGFIGLLQALQQIHNFEENLEAKLRALGLLEAHLQAGTIDLTQVDQFRQSIETQRALLLQSRNAMANTMENYEISTLGLPPDVPLELDDSLIHQFQFISPSISKLQGEFGDFLGQLGQQPGEPAIDALEQFFERLADLRARLEQHATAVHGDLESLQTHSGQRRQAMTPAEQRLFTREIAGLRDSLKDLQNRVREAGPKIGQLRGQLTPATRRQTADRLVHLVTEISRTTDEVSLIQARARVETITLQDENLDPVQTLNIARANRLDWMNNRAALVDTWRLIQYNANALRGGLNVVFSGDVSSVGNNPFQFRSPTGTLRAGLQFDAPFTRLLERNNFRQAIIDYQQQRRQLIQFEDSVQETLRQLLRNLELDKVNLEIQRRAVAIAIRRVDETREVLNQPPPPPQPGQAAGQLGPNAALNLLTALSDLSTSQNNLMSVWLDYYATRMRLAREMGVMQLDDCGMWIDRPLSSAAQLTAEEAPLPPPLPADAAEQVGQRPAEQTEPPTQPEPVPKGSATTPPAAEPSSGRGDGWTSSAAEPAARGSAPPLGRRTGWRGEKRADNGPPE
jgi:hypothetical protein